MIANPLPPSLAPLVMLSDEQAVQRVLGGETFVFELLMRRHNRRLFRVALAITREPHEAEDAVQEAYIRAYRNLGRFEGRSSVVTWLSRITLHEALRLRRRRRHHSTTEDPAMPPDPPSPPSTALAAAIDRLPETHRAVLMLRLVEGLDTRETAASLRMSEANVKVTLHRARRQLLADAVFRREHEAEAIGELRAGTGFDGERCDRLVARVLERLKGQR